MPSVKRAPVHDISLDDRVHHGNDRPMQPADRRLPAHEPGAARRGPDDSPSTQRCLWCGRTFTPRRSGGSAQRFCAPKHRLQYWAAARREGASAVTSVRNGSAAACTLPLPVEATTSGSNPTGIITVSLDVPLRALLMFERNGWLIGSDEDAVASAIIGLIDRALACRLRPVHR